MRRIKSIPVIDRPREKILRRGAASLSEIELLAAVLGSGSAGNHVMRLAAAVGKLMSAPERRLSMADLNRVPGLGPAGICRILAVDELIRRRAGGRGIHVRQPQDILPLVAFIASRRQEHLVCVSLSGAGDVLGTRVVTIGTLTATSVHPREVFADPIADRAAAVILAHNHPSGSVKPSARDRNVTRKLREAGALLGIEVLDHLILAGDSFFSFRKHGLLR